MNSTLKTIISPIASLKLTVVLLLLGMFIIFAGTWAQIDSGIWQVQHQYFHSWFTWVNLQLFLPRPQAGAKPFPGSLPMIGGYTLITLMLVNLLAAHATRFKPVLADLLLLPILGGVIWLLMTWQEGEGALPLVGALALGVAFLAITGWLHGKRTGIILIHLSLIALLGGEIITSRFAVESQMSIDEGLSASYSQDIRESELAVVDDSGADVNKVVAIPQRLLQNGATITDANLPFEIRVDEFHNNSDFVRATGGTPASGGNALATKGVGVGTVLVHRESFSGAGMDAEKVDAPAAFVTLSKQGKSLGTWLVGIIQAKPQPVEVDGKTYQLQLRFRRYYKPYTVELIDFKHEKYLGTDIPRNYSSDIILHDAARKVDRNVTIRMNSPLRYHGETMFQQSFVPYTTGQHPWETTLLQVVNNPGWLLPYAACLVGAFGLMLHFTLLLVNFLRKQLAPASGTVGAARPTPKGGGRGDSYTLKPAGGAAAIWFPLVVVAVCLIYVMTSMAPPRISSTYDLATFSKIPVTYQGRTQPLDSLATNTLRAVSGRTTIYIEDPKTGKVLQELKPIEWLAELWGNPQKANSYPIILIDHPQIKALLGLTGTPEMEKRRRFSIDEVMALRGTPEQKADRLNSLQTATNEAAQAKKRGPIDKYQQKLLDLGSQIELAGTVMELQELYLTPPLAPGQEWEKLGDSLRKAGGDEANLNRGTREFLNVIRAYHQGNAQEFNVSVNAYASLLDQLMPSEMGRVSFERFFNNFAPFYVSIALYVIVFILSALSWIGWRRPFARAAFWVLILAVIIHTLGLIFRIYISGRPPITNLYSSAVFVAWFAALLAVGFEAVFRNGLGSVVASVVGFLSLIIAHNLSGDGDTMQMLQAVLDTNIWLATHVVVINMGYAAVAIAWAFGVIYIISGLFTSTLTPDQSKTLSRIIYGCVCFGMLFSFVGTILGGIWADQSWGRFWGWDPKENGAALVVLWNAVILHARWGGIVRDRGLACLAVFGSVMLAWSWFGTNQLGVGLHSYGFMASAVFWLAMFIISQLGVIAAGLLPMRLWSSAGSAKGFAVPLRK